jgi:hypothetical protein
MVWHPVFNSTVNRSRPLYELNRGFCSRFSNPFLDDAL